MTHIFCRRRRVTQPAHPSRRPNSSVPGSTQGGFTLLESLVVFTIIALLAALGLPSWLSFLDQRRVNTAQSLIYQALRRTQWEASQQHQTRQFSLREKNGLIEWASHPASLEALQATQWTPLMDGVRLADEDNTLLQSRGIYYVRFDHKGNVDSQLGRITMVGSGHRTSHRCVIVSTLIGAMRQGQGHLEPNEENRYCY